MSNIDQFESVFRSAIRDVYEYNKLEFEKILIVSDLDEKSHQDFLKTTKAFYKTAHADDKSEWLSLTKHDYSNTRELLDHVDEIKPELIFTYRNLQSDAWKYPHSLGEYLDVLIQKTPSPVFILPHPEAGYAMDHTMKNCDVVMALTDQLSNDHELVNYAVGFTQKNGVLYLGHIEDIDTFNRYMDAISKIQTIDTEDAIKNIRIELLKQPTNYIKSVIDEIKKLQIPIVIKPEVSFGHHLTEFRKCINEYKVDVLVMNAKDHQQMAMHGLAYPLAVELRQIPLLMI